MKPVIGLVGATLLGCAAAGLYLGLSAGTARDAVLHPEAVRYAAANEWFWPVVAGVCEIVALGGVVWLSGQCREALYRRRPGLDGATRMLARASGEDLRRAVLELPGVAGTEFRLTGTTIRPRLRMRIVCDPDARVNELRTALAEGPLAEHRTAMKMPSLTTAVTFSFVEAPPRQRG